MPQAGGGRRARKGKQALQNLHNQQGGEGRSGEGGHTSPVHGCITGFRGMGTHCTGVERLQTRTAIGGAGEGKPLIPCDGPMHQRNFGLCRGLFQCEMGGKIVKAVNSNVCALHYIWQSLACGWQGGCPHLHMGCDKSQLLTYGMGLEAANGVFAAEKLTVHVGFGKHIVVAYGQATKTHAGKLDDHIPAKAATRDCPVAGM